MSALKEGTAMSLADWAVLFVVLNTSVHLLGAGVVAVRLRPRPPPPKAPDDAPPVSLVRPVCGLDNFCEETLASSFRLGYPRYEVVFCVARANDAAVPLVRRLIAENPHVPARLLIGDDQETSNPKLNNCIKGWDGAQHQWIVLADSNVLMPIDYIERLQASWRPNSGLVCSPPVGSSPANFWAGVECACLNSFQASWQYVADALGIGFAQGKTMLWRRDILESRGGIRALGSETAEDAAATKVIRSLGLHVRLVDTPFVQPLGRRSLREVWSRQVRWARLRRSTFPLCFAPEIFTGALLPMLAGAYAALHYDIDCALVVALIATIWYLPQILLSYRLGWHLSWASPIAMVLRDILHLMVWIDAWLTDDFVWRGNAMSVREADEEVIQRPG
jgi:ceramide glucosyltransferase